MLYVPLKQVPAVTRYVGTSVRQLIKLSSVSRLSCLFMYLYTPALVHTPGKSQPTQFQVARKVLAVSERRYLT